MRRPARLERTGAMEPRDRMWAAIRQMGREREPFSVADIMVLATPKDHPMLRVDTALTYLGGLDKAGYIDLHARNDALPRVCRRYRLAKDVGVEAPHVDKNGKPTQDGRDRQQLWNSARKYKGDFTRRDLAHRASTGTCVITDEQAKFFCAHLERAGYLRSNFKKHGGREFTRYEFVRARDSGPRPPVIGKDLSVMDGNTGAVMCEGTKHD